MATEEQTSEAARGGDRPGPLLRLTRWVENLNDTQFAYLLLSPALLILTVIALYPLLSTFEMSLHADALTGSDRIGEFIGLNNYVGLFQGQLDVNFPSPFLPEVALDGGLPYVDWLGSSLTVTLIFTIISVFFETAIGFGQALVLNQDFRGRRWVRVAIIIPWAVPVVIQGMIVFLLFQPNIGFLVGEQATVLFSIFGFDLTIPTLNQLGIMTGTPLRNTGDAMLIVIIGDVWKTSAFMALLILAGLQSIDRTLYDVAKVTGASPWQQFKMITLPLVLPSVLVAMLFRTIAAMRIYGLIESVASCSTVPSLSCMVVSSWNNNLWPTSATIAFVTAALIGLFVSVYIVKFAGDDQGMI